jgi:type II secretory pathway pseudopilin PulG
MPVDTPHEAAVSPRIRGLRCSGQARGFTVIEVLLAICLTLLIAGALANVVPAARAAFDRVPADLDLQQRGRTAIDVLSHALRAAGQDVAATAGLGLLSDLLPTVAAGDPQTPGGAFKSVTVIAPVTNPAQGVLSADQPGTAAVITLGTAHCPSIQDVCGFLPGVSAVIADGNGGYDVFIVASTAVGPRTLSPDRVLSRAYPAGAVVVEVAADTFRLAAQTDGSSSLVRETAAGAVQPIVDFVEDLTFDVAGDQMPAGFLRLRQIDVSIRVQPQTESMRRAVGARVFRSSIRLRNAS